MGFIPDSVSNTLMSSTPQTNNFLRSLYDVNLSNIQNLQLLSYDSISFAI